MAVPERFTTTVSTRGRIVLPKAIRSAWRWEAGTRLAVESTPQGVLLTPALAFAETRPEYVFGRLACDDPPMSPADMEAAVLEEAMRRRGGG